jgi:hypothetical protein
VTWVVTCVVAVAVPTPASGEYMGCFKDEATRALPVRLSLTSPSIEQCIVAGGAAGLGYVGMQNGGELGLQVSKK